MIPRCVLLLAVGLALPLAFGNPEYALDQYRGFREAMKADDRSEVPMVRAPRDWTYLPRSFAGVAVPREVSMGVAALAGMGFAAWVTLVRKQERLRLAFCLAMLWMLLFGPSTEMNTYSILAPVAAWLAVRDRAAWLAWSGVAWLVASIIRASFPSEAFHGLGFMQPLGALLLLLHLMIATRSLDTPMMEERGANTSDGI
jgi:hypothetical protein